MQRLVAGQEHHKAAKVVLTEWKKGEKLCCYVLPDMKNAVPAGEVFGTVPPPKAVRVAVPEVD